VTKAQADVERKRKELERIKEGLRRMR